MLAARCGDYREKKQKQKQLIIILLLTNLLLADLVIAIYSMEIGNIVRNPPPRVNSKLRQSKV